MSSSSSPQRRNGGDRTLGSDLRAFLSNEERCDVVLVGSDGIRVPASRLVLAARSRVFESMLFGTFRESSSAEVPLDFSGAVLRAVAEFCCSDCGLERFGDNDVASGGREGGDGSGSGSGAATSDCDEAAARELAQLYAAADYLQLDGLGRNVDARARAVMARTECLACAIYDEASEATPAGAGGAASTGGGGAAGGEESALTSSALGVIRSHPGRALLPEDESCGGGVMALRPAALRELIRDPHMNTEEMTLFRALYRWATCDRVSTVERLDIAKKCVVDINLTRIRPTDLVGFVTKSGLVASEVVTKSLVDQAMMAEREGFVFSKPRVRDEGTVNIEMAGMKDVVGTYSPQQLEMRGVTIVKAFARRVVWNGRSTLFWVCSVREGRFCQWRIFAIGDADGAETFSDCVVFYQTLRQDTTRGLMLTDAPPVTWIVCPAGRNPPPTIRWIPS